MHRAGSADYVIGIDTGTQGVRGLAVASDGTMVARVAVALPSETLRIASNGVFEQDANALSELRS